MADRPSTKKRCVIKPPPTGPGGAVRSRMAMNCLMAGATMWVSVGAVDVLHRDIANTFVSECEMDTRQSDTSVSGKVHDGPDLVLGSASVMAN